MRLLVRRSRESSGGDSSREDAEVGSVETRCGGAFSEAAEEDSGKVNESLATHSHTSFWSRVFLAPAREAHHVGWLTAVDLSLGTWSGFRIQGRYHSSTDDLIKNEY
jgi:hypothetical protein